MSEQPSRPALTHSARRLPPPLQPNPPGPRLGQVLSRVLPLPPGNVMLGLCDDGLPLLFDLDEPDTGGMIISGDSSLANGLLLKSALLSACRMNPPERLNLSLVSPRPDFFASLEREPHLRINFHTRSKEAALLVEECANLVEERRAAGESSPAQMLAIDDLSELLTVLADHQRELIAWVCAEGPAAGVWVFATDGGAAGPLMTGPLLEGFPTRMFTRSGRGRNAWAEPLELGERLANLDAGREALLAAGEQLIDVQVVLAERADYDLLASEARQWSARDEALSQFPMSAGGE